MPERYIDVSAAARRLTVACETVRAWIRSGRLEAISTPTGRYKIPSSALDRFCRSRKAQDPQTNLR